MRDEAAVLLTDDNRYRVIEPDVRRADVRRALSNRSTPPGRPCLIVPTGSGVEFPVERSPERARDGEDWVLWLRCGPSDAARPGATLEVEVTYREPNGAAPTAVARTRIEATDRLEDGELEVPLRPRVAREGHFRVECRSTAPHSTDETELAIYEFVVSPRASLALNRARAFPRLREKNELAHFSATYSHSVYESGPAPVPTRLRRGLKGVVRRARAWFANRRARRAVRADAHPARPDAVEEVAVAALAAERREPELGPVETTPVDGVSNDGVSNDGVSSAKEPVDRESLETESLETESLEAESLESESLAPGPLGGASIAPRPDDVSSPAASRAETPALEAPAEGADEAGSTPAAQPEAASAAALASAARRAPMPDAMTYYMGRLTAASEAPLPDFRARLVEWLERHPRRRVRILSLASGAARIEESLLEGLPGERVELTLTDLNPDLLERARARFAHLGQVIVQPLDLNRVTLPKARYDVALCVSALHHVVELEGLVEGVAAALVPDGEFWSIGEYVGRNGTRLHEDALRIANDFFRALPERYRVNRNPGSTGEIDEVLPNFDCSTTCFEGIRSEDIEPILERHFDVTARFRIDCFCWRLFNVAYLQNYDLDRPEDLALVDRAVDLELDFLRAGGRPTALWGAYRPRPRSERAPLSD